MNVAVNVPTTEQLQQRSRQNLRAVGIKTQTSNRKPPARGNENSEGTRANVFLPLATKNPVALIDGKPVKRTPPSKFYSPPARHAGEERDGRRRKNAGRQTFRKKHGPKKR